MLPNKSVSGFPLNKIGEAFKDVKLPKATREKLMNPNPFEQNINQLHEIQKVEKKRKSSVGQYFQFQIPSLIFLVENSFL